MNMNKPMQTLLSEEEQRLVQMKLLELLEQQTKKYTSVESTSIPVELRQELMNSIVFCMGVSVYGLDYKGQMDWKRILHAEFADIFQRGIAFIQEKMSYGEALWEKICMHLPEVENQSMLDTLGSLGAFWKKYDYRFFAHEIPCDIDYQLCIPIAEEKQGIVYVLSYLEQLATENLFLSCFEKEAMRAVLNRYCPDYRGLLINLYEPIVTNAIGCALLDKGFHELVCSEKEQEALTALFENLTGEEITDCIRNGAETVLTQISCDNRREEELIEWYGRELAVRIAGVKDVGGMAGIFL